MTEAEVKVRPLFSILLPTRNRLQLLKGAIETVRRQEETSWEIVVSDNASTEDVAGYIKSLQDERIKYIRSETALSVTQNWNRALAQSTGDYVIMLGDDDGLLDGYFKRLEGIIQTERDLDIIYHGAYHFTFPNTFPGQEFATLSDETGRAIFLRKIDQEGYLEKSAAMEAVQQALEMRMVYGFNMQYFVFSRTFINRMKEYGEFYQGPFPDFYAANMSLMKAQKIKLIKAPLLVIGVSPKSYGFFHNMHKDTEGLDFLDNATEISSLAKEQGINLLPGSNLNTSWIVSVGMVKKNLQKEVDLKLGVARYRKMQLYFLARLRSETGNWKNIKKLWPLLSSHEKIMSIVFDVYFLPLTLSPAMIKPFIRRVLSWRPAYGFRLEPEENIKTLPNCQTVVDVFEEQKFEKART